jgi:N utilization substance protein A
MKSEFVAAIRQLCAEKGVPESVVMEALEAALVSAYKRNFNAMDQRVAAEIDSATGSVRVFVEHEVVDPSEVEELLPEHILLKDARKIRPDAQVGDVLRDDVTPPTEQLGRIAAQTAKQVVLQKLRDAERKMIYDEFAERKDEIVHGIVQRIEQGNVIVEIGKAEALMPRSEQVPTERYYPGQRIRVYVSEVHETHRGPQIIVSRAHRFMLRRLFEQEVPEIYNGVVEIKGIAREAGARSKVAVAARQAGVDPVGACVGMRGVRIQNIVNELGGEKVDIVEWDEDAHKFVANALSPAQVLSVETNDDEKTARVVVPERQLSLAIGKEGQNARLAAKLTGWRIDIKSDVAVAAEAARAEDERTPSALETEGRLSGAAPGVRSENDEATPGEAPSLTDQRTEAATDLPPNGALVGDEADNRQRVEETSISSER